MEEKNKISYGNYRSTYLNFASINTIDGPLSIESTSSLIFELNRDYIDGDTLDRIKDVEYITNENVVTSFIKKAIEEVTAHNINSYYKNKKPIKLSDAIVIDEQKQIVMYLEDLIDKIRVLPQEDAINSYIELKDIILNKKLEGYDLLNNRQQNLIEKIELPIANNLFDYRNNAKQYKITQ